MIIVKWLTDWEKVPNGKPPSIISSMINMCLGFGESSNNETNLISNQTLVMQSLLFIALICVPLMLFVKPLYEIKHQKNH